MELAEHWRYRQASDELAAALAALDRVQALCDKVDIKIAMLGELAPQWLWVSEVRAALDGPQ